MLRQRVITALLLIPLVVWAIFGLPSWALAMVLGALVLLGAWEWTRLIPLASLPARLIYLLLVAVALAAAWRLSRVHPELLLAAAALWWLAATAWVLCYPGAQAGTRSASVVKWVCGFLTLVPAWAALTILHATPLQGPWLVLLVLVLIWVADSGAYFAGRKWGRHKLAPAVSPGKTWEGVGGALAACVPLVLGAGVALDLSTRALLLLLPLCLLVVAISIVGDLFESLLKRDQGLKDSGTLLPGHGGVLDRIDSLTAAAPVFALGWRLIGGAT